MPLWTQTSYKADNQYLSVPKILDNGFLIITPFIATYIFIRLTLVYQYQYLRQLISHYIPPTYAVYIYMADFTGSLLVPKSWTIDFTS